MNRASRLRQRLPTQCSGAKWPRENDWPRGSRRKTAPRERCPAQKGPERTIGRGAPAQNTPERTMPGAKRPRENDSRSLSTLFCAGEESLEAVLRRRAAGESLDAVLRQGPSGEESLGGVYAPLPTPLHSPKQWRRVREHPFPTRPASPSRQSPRALPWASTPCSWQGPSRPS